MATSTSRSTHALRAGAALTLALAVSACGSGVQTTIGAPQTITATLPKPVKASDTKFPAIGTRFVLPKHLARDQKAPIHTYIRWNVASLTSLKAGKMDKKVKPLSSGETYRMVKTQVQKAAAHPGAWGTIVEKIRNVERTGSSASFGVCMVITAGNGTKTKSSLAVQMGQRGSGWYVSRFGASPVKVPGC